MVRVHVTTCCREGQPSFLSESDFLLSLHPITALFNSPALCKLRNYPLITSFLMRFLKLQWAEHCMSNTHVVLAFMKFMKCSHSSFHDVLIFLLTCLEDSLEVKVQRILNSFENAICDVNYEEALFEYSGTQITRVSTLKNTEMKKYTVWLNCQFLGQLNV